MRTLILSCNTGEGHNSCAKAIREVFVAKGEQCDIVDALSMVSPKFSDFVSRGHVFIYRRLPRLFSWGYEKTEEYAESHGENAALYKLFNKGADALSCKIRDGGYNCVICTHPFASLMLAEAGRRYDLHIRTAFVATDYTCSPTVAEGKVDTYFIPAESLLQEFAAAGVPEGKIVPSGIPVRQMFYEKHSQQEAKQAFGIQPQSRHIVMMCGSMGCGPIRELVDALAQDMPEHTELTVVCGTNEKLKEQLSQKYAEHSRIHIHGFVRNVSLLMDSADLYITKPGGISVTEAAVKGVPMVLMEAVDGCERYNGDFFVKLGGAVSEKEVTALHSQIDRLLTDDAGYISMRVSLAAWQPPNAAERIYAVMKESEVTMSCGS